MIELSLCFCFLIFKQKTGYEMRISDRSSDVGSSDLDDVAGVDARLCDQRPADLADISPPFLGILLCPVRMVGVEGSGTAFDGEAAAGIVDDDADRKSTRLNSSH